LARIRINETDEDSDQLRPRVEAERRRSMVISSTPTEWYIADKGKEVTDDFITGPPGSGLDVKSAEQGPGPTASGARVVFVVHGRNQKARDALFTFLRSIGLHPLEWLEAIQATGKPTPYIGDILDAAFSNAQAVVVLLSPDDEARLREPFQAPGDPPHEKELTSQARPNVLFEAGMDMGRDPNRTILVEVGHLRPFSDIAGRHVVRLDNSTQRRQELAQRLEAAGCPVNLTGTDWHTAGDFDSSLP
jgi:predicted nucleotide-binding protein